MSFLEHIPKEIIKSKNSSEMSVELINGSVYHLLGMDGKNASKARGMNPNFVILSEYAFMDRESWDIIEPRISMNKGQAIFISTPNGQNHFYHLYNWATQEMKKPNSDYFSSHLTIDDTGVYGGEFLETKRGEGMPEDFIQQEYFCSFTRGAEGSYYGKQVQAAREEDRITKLPIVPDLPVHTSWDIGVGDSSAIWFFQQLSNGKINFINFYENNGLALDHYIEYLDQWKAKQRIVYGTHFVPHDMRNRDFGTKGALSRMEIARNMGYTFRPCVTEEGKAFGLEAGIDAVRALLPLCSFDAEKCKRGVQCLDFYRKKWNEALKVYFNEPLHDQYSHAADAFRMAAIGIKAFGVGGNDKMTPDKINEMRRKHYGY